MQVEKEKRKNFKRFFINVKIQFIEMMAKDGKIQTLEKDIETIRAEAKTGHESQVCRDESLR